MQYTNTQGFGYLKYILLVRNLVILIFKGKFLYVVYIIALSNSSLIANILLTQLQITCLVNPGTEECDNTKHIMYTGK